MEGKRLVGYSPEGEPIYAKCATCGATSSVAWYQVGDEMLCETCARKGWKNDGESLFKPRRRS